MLFGRTRYKRIQQGAPGRVCSFRERRSGLPAGLRPTAWPYAFPPSGAPTERSLLSPLLPSEGDVERGASLFPHLITLTPVPLPTFHGTGGRATPTFRPTAPSSPAGPGPPECGRRGTPSRGILQNNQYSVVGKGAEKVRSGTLEREGSFDDAKSSLIRKELSHDGFRRRCSAPVASGSQ